MSEPAAPARLPYAETFLVSLAAILLEVDYTRVFSYKLVYYFTYVVIGLALILVYGNTGWFGEWLTAHGIQVIFSVPGMILATIFVSLPFVVREVVPVLREIGTEQEQAAATLGSNWWQTFWRATLPSLPSLASPANT